MRSYHQLDIKEREKIYLGLSQGISLRKIAVGLGRSHSTVIREVRRNKSQLGYLPDRANSLARERNYLKHCKLDIGVELKRYVLDKLINCHWSPEQIAGRLKLKKKGFYICKESIYQ